MFTLAGLILALAWLLPLHLWVRRAERRQRLDRCWGHCWEILLYADHPRPMLASLRDLLLAQLRFLWLLRAPLVLWLLVAALVFAWLEPRAQQRLPRPGEWVVVSLACSAPPPALQVLSPVECSPPLWASDEQRAYWRVRSPQSGDFPLQAGGHSVWLGVGQGIPRWWQSRSPLHIHYPQQTFWFGDRPVPWQLWLLLIVVPCFLLGEWLLARLPEE